MVECDEFWSQSDCFGDSNNNLFVTHSPDI